MRRNRNKNYMFFYGVFACLLCVMTVGYAAFSADLNINVKGNIKDYNAAWQLKKQEVTSGDGLYKDKYEDGRYIYRGGNPNNYISFNNELWRIISIEKDGALKIIKKDSITTMAFDKKGARTMGYCSLGTAPTRGCNVWNINNDFADGIYSGAVEKDAEINTYLNNVYYEGLSTEAKNKIISYTWNVGSIVFDNNDLMSQIQLEKRFQWTGKIALMNVSDYLKADLDSTRCGTININKKNANGTICYDTNYLNKLAVTTAPVHAWMLTPNTSGHLCDVVGPQITGYVGTIGSSWPSNSNYSVIPVVFLNSNVKLSGDGTELNPYQINL